MKKTLALVLALAMVFSTITVAFAEGTIGAEAQVCADLGMLKGETGTVDAAYVATAPTRLQAAVMFLRLKGLEAEALAFTGEDNFADGNIAWAEGANLLAYLKANPQLGWVGDGTNFNPNNTITAKEYYKVLLETLGYKQNTAEVVGDFTWENVIEFAASKGLSKVAEVADYTVNDLAIATVEALKANVKDGETTLVASLVEAGKVDAAKAVAAGLYEDAATTEAKLDTVSALGNAVVLVEFDADVEKAFAENVANYNVVEKGTTTAVEVKAATLDATETTLVVLETAALTAGKAYTLTVGEVSVNFAGIAKDASAPEIDKVEGTDTERVVVTFTTSMDMATGLDAANYAIAGVTVESVAWDDPDGARDAVELTTKGLVANKTYKVTVTNVKSADGVVLKSDSMNFVAKSDKKAPKLDDDNTDALTNTRILVTFSDDNEITKESAEDLANYKVTLGSGDTELEITAAKLVEDANDDEKAVELTTVPQKGSQKYVVHVNNIVDTSVLANKMTKEETATIYGERVDDEEPTYKSIEYLSDTLIQVTFDDDSRLDFATAQDINNYSINNDIEVEKAEMLDADDADCMKVRLTVSELGDDKSYKVTVSNVADEYGNAIDEETKSKSFDKDDAVAISTVSKIRVTDTDTVVLYFTKELIEASAEDVANYEIDDEIGTPKKAVYDDDAKTVTLTTAEMVTNHKYDLTINGVKDIAENVLTDVELDFVVSLTSNDIDAPEIEDVEAVSKYVVRVTFSEPIDIAAAPSIWLDNDILHDNTTSGGQTWKNDNDLDNDEELKGDAAAVAYDDDDMVVEFYFAGGPLVDEDVVLVRTTAKDLAGNVCTDTYEFSSVNDAPEDVELLSWDQVTVRKFELQFSEKVRLQDTISNLSAQLTGIGGYDFTPVVDTDDKSLWYLEANKIMDADEELQFNISAIFENYHDFAVVDADDTATDSTKKTTFETGIEDDEEPYIEEVVAIDRTHVDITFSEELQYAGTYDIKYIDDDGEEADITISGTPALDEDVVTLTLSDNLSSKVVYTLYVDNQARDLAGNKVDEDAEYDFAGTDVVAVDNYIEGVKVYNGSTLVLETFKSIGDTEVASIVYGDDPTDYEGATTAVSPTSGKDTEFKVVVATVSIGADLDGDTVNDTVPVLAFADGVEYTVSIDGMDYEFEGIVDDDVVVSNGTDGDGKYDVSYDDSEVDDLVVFLDDTGAFVDYAEVATEDGDVELDATEDSIVSVLVLRDGVVLYYLNNFDLTDAQ